MQKFFYNFCLLLLTCADVWYSYFYLFGKYQLAGMFLGGLILGILLMNLKLNVNNDKINSYKRELEKESVASNNNLARVKVLESKIEVLEKALENALNK